MTSYNIESYFQSSGAENNKTYTWAKYVDNGSSGNKNGSLDGKEIEIFKNIIKHRYEFDYSFEKADSIQNMAICENGENQKTYIAKALYTNEDCDLSGATKLGFDYYDTINGPTLDYNKLETILEKVSEFPVTKEKRQIIEDFLFGSGLDSNWFEQMASEYGTGIKNGTALKFLEAIMEVVPEEKRTTEDYKILENCHNLYKDKSPDEKFENSKWSFFSRMFGCDNLSPVDNAIKNLFLE